jgi:hypothetical protein
MMPLGIYVLFVLTGVFSLAALLLVRRRRNKSAPNYDANWFGSISDGGNDA